MEWTKLFFVKSLACLASGIALGRIFTSAELSFYTLLAINLLFFVPVSLIHLLSKRSARSYYQPLKSIMILAFVICHGFTLYKIRQPAFDTSHFSHYSFTQYEAELARPLVKGKNSVKGVLKVKAIKTAKGWQKAGGKIMGFFSPGDSIPAGTILLISDAPRVPDRPLNPLQFDYKEYLQTQDIYHIAFIHQYSVGKQAPSIHLFRIAEICVNQINRILRRHIQDQSAFALVQGLLLGDKSEMDPETNQMYTMTGLAHVLAVSGFHTALIYQLLIALLAFLPSDAFGKTLFTITVISSLWFYAICTGLSASVVRAALMLSLLVSTRLIKRRPHTLHILCLSAFLILLHSPQALFDIGLQLSFTAVAGILCANQALSRNLQIRQPIIRKLWEWTCVSISAQLFTYPLLLLYFHDLPLYFIPANLISTMPVIALIYMGILLLASSWLSWLAGFIGLLIHYTTWFLNGAVALLATLPSFTQELYFHPLQIILLFLFTALFISGLYQKRAGRLWLSYLLLTLFTLITVFEFYKSSRQRILAVFHTKDHSFIAFIEGFHATIFTSHSNTFESSEYRYSVSSYLGSRHVRSIVFDSIPQASLISYSGRSIALINGSGQLQIRHQPDYIIATRINSPISGIPEHMGRVKLIFDGSCNKRALKDVNSSIHSTWIKGAYIEHF